MRLCQRACAINGPVMRLNALQCVERTAAWAAACNLFRGYATLYDTRQLPEQGSRECLSRVLHLCNATRHHYQPARTG